MTNSTLACWNVKMYASVYRKALSFAGLLNTLLHALYGCMWHARRHRRVWDIDGRLCAVRRLRQHRGLVRVSAEMRRWLPTITGFVHALSRYTSSYRTMRRNSPSYSQILYLLLFVHFLSETLTLHGLVNKGGIVANSCSLVVVRCSRYLPSM